jgi:hypothetical protein
LDLGEICGSEESWGLSFCGFRDGDCILKQNYYWTEERNCFELFLKVFERIVSYLFFASLI